MRYIIQLEHGGHVIARDDINERGTGTQLLLPTRRGAIRQVQRLPKDSQGSTLRSLKITRPPPFADFPTITTVGGIGGLVRPRPVTG